MAELQGHSGPPLPSARLGTILRGYWAQFVESVRTTLSEPPRARRILALAIVAAALLYLRSPLANFIFDEQEALLANPYVNGHSLRFSQLFQRDFWGLPRDGSIGSYRPLPNLFWRLLWRVQEASFLPQLLNVVFHGVNAALLTALTYRWTMRRRYAWLTGATFLAAAILTEAVAGVVGLADVMGGTGILLALYSLRLPLWGMFPGVALGMALGLLSKESTMVGVLLIPWAALLLAPVEHRHPFRWLRAAAAGFAAAGTFVGYVEFRRYFFRVPGSRITSPNIVQVLRDLIWHPQGDVVAGAGDGGGFSLFLSWFDQPTLPHDPMNNPLIGATTVLRLAGAFRVFARGLGQVIFPWNLAGDYSFPQEPVPQHWYEWPSLLGAALFVLLPLAGLMAAAILLYRQAAPERRSERFRHWRWTMFALGSVWLVGAFFPQSNIPILLPTVRAERLWYLSVFGSSWMLALTYDWLWERRQGALRWAFYGAMALLVFGAVRARWYTFYFSNDLMFWDAARRSSSQSAKAHLNYSVMLGARGRMAERLTYSRRATELAPNWPMAHIYLGDTLCRMDRPAEAYPHYLRGWELAPNDRNLSALAVQCLWDHGYFQGHRDDLVAYSRTQPGTWIAAVLWDAAQNGDTQGGVKADYRPRGYNEGPKK